MHIFYRWPVGNKELKENFIKNDEITVRQREKQNKKQTFYTTEAVIHLALSGLLQQNSTASASSRLDELSPLSSVFWAKDLHRHIFLEIRRATLFRLLKLAVNTNRPFVAICRSWCLRYRRPIPKANTRTPWFRKASAGLRTRSCEMPSVMTTRAWKEGKIQIDPLKVRANDSRIVKP